MKMRPHPAVHPHKTITRMSPPPPPLSLSCVLEISHIAGYWLLLFVFLLTSTFSRSIKTQKSTWLISSQPDLMSISSSRAYPLLATALVSDQLYLQPLLWNPRLNGDVSFLMKSSRKRSRPLLGLPNWTFPLFLSSCKRPFNSFLH